MMAFSVGVGLFFSFYGISHSVTASGYQMLPIMDSFVMFHTIFTSVFTAAFVCSEFSGRTVGMGLLCGLPRRKVFLAKITAYFAGLLCLLSAVVVTPMVAMSLVNGFGMELTAGNCMDFLAQAAFFWLACSAIGGFFLFLAMATKNTAATMGAGLGIAYLMLVLASNYVNADVERFSPVRYSVICQMFILGDWENLSKGLFLGVVLVTLAVTLAASALIFERSELA